MPKYKNSLQWHCAFAKYVVSFLMHDCSSKSMVKEGGCKSEASSSAKHISSADNWKPPIYVPDLLIVCYGNMILHQKRNWK